MLNVWPCSLLESFLASNLKAVDILDPYIQIYWRQISQFCARIAAATVDFSAIFVEYYDHDTV